MADAAAEAGISAGVWHAFGTSNAGRGVQCMRWKASMRSSSIFVSGVVRKVIFWISAVLSSLMESPPLLSIDNSPIFEDEKIVMRPLLEREQPVPLG